jgi:chromosome partitioning protein
MQIICPKCGKKYNVDEKRLTPAVKTARCKECGERFPISLQPASAEESVSSAPPVEAPKGPRRICVSLSKGGVGKTTTSVNLSAGLALAGFKVLLIDSDTQGQSAFYLGVSPKGGLAELVGGDLTPEEAMTEARDNLWLLAGGRQLAGLKRLIDRKDFGGEQTISEALSPIEKDFDYVVVDTSPGWDPLTVSVLFYVNELLIPVSLEVMSVQGFGEFLKSIAAIQKYRRDVHLKYILPTFQDMRVKKSGIILEKFRNLYGDLVCSPIRYTSLLSENPALGQSIFEMAPDSKGAEDYRELVRKVAGDPNLFK